jgi:hypothetical protein
VNNEFKGMWKEADVTELLVLFQNLLEGTEENHKNISVSVYWPGEEIERRIFLSGKYEVI